MVHYGGIRPIRQYPDEWHFGGAEYDGAPHPQFLDLIVPDGVSKQEWFSCSHVNHVELPMIRMS